MSSDDVPTGRDALQFDRVEQEGSQDGSHAGAEAHGVLCAVCGKSVGAEYYHANDKPVCDNCRQIVTAEAETPRGTGVFVKAGLLGLLAAVAGAAIYYAVIAITNFEIGLVAILIGYMVGYMVRRGASGRGGRRFQILAAVLTYWAVGLAYAPLAFKGMTDDDAVTSDSTSASSADSTLSSSADSAVTALDDSATIATTVDGDGGATRLSPVKAIGMLMALVFALPVMSIAQSMPGGILSALIIFIGLRQAWTMTGAHALEISGPYRVGRGPVPATE